MRHLLGIVTAFTVAHSLTLAAAALGWVSVSSHLVEPAIAATVVYIGVENLLAKELQHRWLVTLGLGLVHGFGFATLLRQTALPEDLRLAALVAFNLGVEAGQLALIAVLSPVLLLLWLRPRLGPARVLRGGGSLLVAGLGLYWLVERLVIA